MDRCNEWTLAQQSASGWLDPHVLATTCNMRSLRAAICESHSLRSVTAPQLATGHICDTQMRGICTAQK